MLSKNSINSAKERDNSLKTLLRCLIIANIQQKGLCLAAIIPLSTSLFILSFLFELQNSDWYSKQLEVSVSLQNGIFHLPQR